MRVNSDPSSPFECVDPKVGEQLPLRELDSTDDALRRQLEAHIEVCDACRHLVALDGYLAQDHDLARRRRRAARGRSWYERAAWAALAASLALVVLLPPRAVTPARTTRGLEPIRFLRPVEGEVVLRKDVSAEWISASGPARYRIELRDEHGQSVWSTETAAREATAPGGDLVAGTRYRLLLTTVPRDLGPLTPASVEFRVGTLAEAAAHRVRWGNLWGRAGVVVSTVALGVLYGVGRRRGGAARSGRAPRA